MDKQQGNPINVTRARILLVTDDVDAVKVWVLALNQSGYDVVLLINGAAVLRVWSEKQPDLIVLADFNERLDALAVCYSLREISSVPVIFLTCKNNETYQLEAYRAGADEVVSFPATPRLFQAKLTAWLRRSTNKIYNVPGRTQLPATSLLKTTLLNPANGSAARAQPEKKTQSLTFPQPAADRAQPAADRAQPAADRAQPAADRSQPELGLTQSLHLAPEPTPPPPDPDEVPLSYFLRQESQLVDATLPEADEFPFAFPPQAEAGEPERFAAAVPALETAPAVMPPAAKRPEAIQPPAIMPPAVLPPPTPASLPRGISSPAAEDQPQAEGIPVTALDTMRASIFPEDVLEEIYPGAHRSRSSSRATSLGQTKKSALQGFLANHPLTLRQWVLVAGVILVEGFMISLIGLMLLAK
jgi:DNA-binding response OmpR family regulator